MARVRVILSHQGITSGSLVIAESDKKRSKGATTFAHLYQLRENESGGDL